MPAKRKEIDLNLLQRLARLQCPYHEMASVLEVSLATFERRMKNDKAFAVIVSQARDEGNVAVRRAMHASAVGGNVVAQIWWGKQHLGMREPPKAIEVTGAGGSPVSLTWKDIATRAVGREP